MADDQKNHQESGALPPELSLKGMRKKTVSPLNGVVWRLLLLVSGGCLAARLIPTIFGFRSTATGWAVAVILLISWLAAIRLLLLESKAKKFWLAWLVVGFAILVFVGSPQAWAETSFSFVFLLFRRYRPYRHLSSRRQGWLFLIGIAAFILLTLAWPTFEWATQPTPSRPQAAPATGPPNMGLLRCYSFALDSLRMFWFFSLFNLFFSIRLHFMRLRPKLAVSAVLIAIIPLLLVIFMGILATYALLGESRAIRASAILNDWADLAARSVQFLPSISGKCFSYRETGDGKGVFSGEKPAYWESFYAALRVTELAFSELTSPKTVVYFWINQEVWLIDLGQLGAPEKMLRACQVDHIMLDRLARILNCEIELYRTNPINLAPHAAINFGTKKKTQTVSLDDKDFENAIRGKLMAMEEKAKMGAVATGQTFWRRANYFGMSNLEVIVFENGRFQKRSLLLTTKAVLPQMLAELLSGQNPLTQIVLGILIAIAVVFLFFEALALFLGVRITSGITKAVRVLHKGTRRIAAGDLDTPINIPNEDELGDLAYSFNQMSAAVKRGREEAIARGILERELQTAREIQQRLLPHEMPLVRGFEICGTSLPSRQVSGDYFDFIDTLTGDLGIAVGDVSGKGMPAALLMASLQASLHAQVIKMGAVSELLVQMNNLLVQSTDKHMFATFFYGILNRTRSRFTWSNGGHNPPLLFRAEGGEEKLEGGGLILGFLPDQTYAQKETDIRPGDILVLYTDGITEASAPSAKGGERDLFGEGKLIDVVRANQKRSALDIQSAILNAISSFTENMPQEDDITLVIIKKVPA